MQDVYNPEAMGMESLKMDSFFRCKRRKKLHGLSNVAVHSYEEVLCSFGNCVDRV